jgi:hypothetical protein
VLDPIDSQEREWSLQSREPGEQYLVRPLTQYRAAWAIIRQWASHDVAVARREKRIVYLEEVLTRVAWELRRPEADPERIASRIARALQDQ